VLHGLRITSGVGLGKWRSGIMTVRATWSRLVPSK
jgi:hypothetical protein